MNYIKVIFQIICCFIFGGKVPDTTKTPSLPPQDYSGLQSLKRDCLKKHWNGIKLHDVYFFPVHPKRIDVFCFFKTDENLEYAIKEDIVGSIRAFIEHALTVIKREEELKFIFDSHENVVRSYQSNYGLRLRG